MMGSPMSSNPKYYPIPMFKPLPPITTSAVALRLTDAIRRRFLARSSLKNISLLGDMPRLKDLCHQRALQFTGFNCFQWSFNAFSSTLMNLSFFNGDESRSGSKDFGKQQARTSRRNLFDGRQWTNILLAANVLVFVAQSVSDVGPVVENICGPKRYLTIYFSSAIASSAMSYWFSKAPAVGASGAIFGLVGSFAVFVLRHRGMARGTDGDLKHIAQVIVLNMTIGLLSQGIDNWGHVGGLIGGAAISWLLGPAWELDAISRDGKKIFVDKAPIFSLIRRPPK